MNRIDDLMEWWDETLREYQQAKSILDHVEPAFYDVAQRNFEAIEYRLMAILKEIKQEKRLPSTVGKPSFTRNISLWFQNTTLGELIQGGRK